MKKKFSQSLGGLEAQIMNVIWELEKVSVRKVLSALNKKVAYTTVMTVMGRLYNKKILKRQLDKSGAYIYSPSKNKETFLKEVSQTVIKNFMEEFGELGVAQFVEVLNKNQHKKIKEWKKKLKKVR